jgi:hypothetical protein
MTATLSPEVAAYQAKEVQQFLSHDAVQRALTATEDELKEAWANRAKTPEEREACYQELQGFRRWQRKLRALAAGRPLAILTED